MNRPGPSNVAARLLLVAGLVGGLTLQAMPPAELDQRLARGEKITVIDIRATSLFQKGHIPNAINIPGSLIPLKNLPSLGRVVVYDGGLGADETAAAVAALNQRSGIQAETLDGGFAAWEAARGQTTRESGVGAEELPMITYDALKKAQNENVVLVDLRKAPPAGPTVKKAATAVPAPPLTDLREAFPKVGAVTESPFQLPQRRQSAGASSEPPLLVLIDAGDGAAAQNTARTLRANGVKRVVILAGGEEILSRQGQPGLQRAGGSTGAVAPVPPK